MNLRMIAALMFAAAAWCETGTVVRNLADQTFTHVPGSPPCMTSSVQHGDPQRGPTVTLIRLTAGCSIPWHWHTAQEQIMFFQGSGRFQARGGQPVTVRSGGYIFVPAHTVERFRCDETCVIFLYTNVVSDIHFVDSGDKEISYGEARDRETASHRK